MSDDDKRGPGRPASGRTYKRTVAFPPDLYEEVEKIAQQEDRTVTLQIINALRDFVERYRSEGESSKQHLATAFNL